MEVMSDFVAVIFVSNLCCIIDQQFYYLSMTMSNDERRSENDG